MPLSELQCKGAKAQEKPYRKADGGGMYLEVMPNGSKYWRLKYRFGGLEKRLALGVYPEVSLKEARDKRESARKLLADNIDPSFAKKVNKVNAALNASNTFQSIAEEWIEHNCENWSDNHKENIKRRFLVDVFPKIGCIPIKDVTAPMLHDVIKSIEKRGAHELARRALQMSGQVFRYAIVTGRGGRDISADLKGALKPFKRGHYAALEAKDLPEFLKVLERNEARLFPQTRYAVELMLLTFVRTSELIQAKWDEFDFEDKMWVVPAARMKMKKEHMVPLSKQSLAILEKLKMLHEDKEYVFPSQTDPQGHMSNNTILFALGRMGYRGQHTGHGFRALAMSTIKEKLGYRHEVVDRQLAHAHKNTIDRAYDRAKFLDDRKTMMQEWSDYIDAVAAPSAIIKFRKKEA